MNGVDPRSSMTRAAVNAPQSAAEKNSGPTPPLAAIMPPPTLAAMVASLAPLSNQPKVRPALASSILSVIRALSAT